MALKALLLSEDQDVIQLLRSLLPELGIHTDQCVTSASARKLLTSQKYEAIIVDADTIGSLGFLTSLRQLPQSRNAIIFALIHAVSVTVAFQAGANFVLEKPLTLDRAQRSFRAAQGLILRERRRYYRHSVNMFATLEYGNNAEAVTITNLSEGGMAIEVGSNLAAGTVLKWKFDLADRRGTLEGKGEVSWFNAGKAGVRFVHVPIPYKIKLEEWLAERAQEEPTSPILGEEESWRSQV
ncbi:MAG TPA: PilZ domain-containing protein [Candidatus Koribacter sp.]